jgi:ribosomal protein L11 methyltransferase
MNYVEVQFVIQPMMPAREVLVAELAELGFESFVENDNGLLAYIQENEFEPSLLDGLMTKDIPDQQLEISHKVIQDQNWNAEWEKGFDPIFVSDECVIRAPFHTDLGTFKYDLLIEPKMSFGTGHHATTFLIVNEMLSMDFEGKDVLDMGCGTGVLAILAEKRGAKHCVGIDIDEWSYENTIENIERNGCSRIVTKKGGEERIEGETFDIILANINRNILMRDMHVYVKAMRPSATLLLSGFYLQDVADLRSNCESLGLTFREHKLRGEWCMMCLTKGGDVA